MAKNNTKDALLDASVLEDLITEELTPGEVVRMHRLRLELTQKELGEISGIKPNLISQYETGANVIGKDVAEKFAVALEIRPESILYPAGKLKLTSELKKISSRAHAFRLRRLKESKKNNSLKVSYA